MIWFAYNETVEALEHEVDELLVGEEGGLPVVLDLLALRPTNRDFTVSPGSSDPPEKFINIFALENGVYTIY